MGKKKNAEKNLARKERQERKQAKAAKKQAGKVAKDAGEEDIEAILQEFMKKEAAKTKVTVQVLEKPPSPRANFSLTAIPSGDMIMFGGEYFNGEVNECFNELYRWNVELQEWKAIISPNTPPPRCSHQAVYYRDHLYIFGGEFATADQFYHYRDMWRLNLKTNAWECIEAKDSPSPRSGHRMIVWRNYLVVFGGFYEAYRETKWFNDLFLFNFAELKWKKISFPVHKYIPGPRSGCQLAVHPSNDTVFMYGGYAKIKVQGQKTQGKTYNDMWSLNMSPVTKGHDPTWEKLSRKGSPPTPRCGATMTIYKNKALLFGGVYDEEGSRHAISSVFYNDLYAFDMDRRRWFRLQLRGSKQQGKRRRKKKPKTTEGAEADGEDDDIDSLSDDEEDDDDDDDDEKLQNQFGYVDVHGNIVYIEDEEAKDEESKEESKEEEMIHEEPVFSSTELENKTEEVSIPSIEPLSLMTPTEVAPPVPSLLTEESPEEEPQTPQDPAPLPRINPALMVRNNTLYVFGGVLEDGNREITLDDCWSLDIKKLDKWNEVLKGTMEQQQWHGDESETEGSSYASDDDLSDFDDELDAMDAVDDEEKQAAAVDNEGDEDAEVAEKKEKKKKSKSKKSKGRKGLREEIEKLQEELNLADVERTPAAGENLREFFKRTAAYWAQQVANLPETIEQQLDLKAMKRKGFSLAEERYNELLPVLERLNELEEQQNAAEEEAKSKSKSRSRR